MALAFEQLGPGGQHRDALLEQAAACGRNLATVGPADLHARLTDIGYDPATAPDGTMIMRNCPFDSIVEVARDTVCSMNLALLSAFASAKHRIGTKPHSNRRSADAAYCSAPSSRRTASTVDSQTGQPPPRRRAMAFSRRASLQRRVSAPVVQRV